MASEFALSRFPALERLSSAWTIIRDESVTLDRDNVLPISRAGRTHAEMLDELKAFGTPGWVQAWGPLKHLWLNYGLLFEDRFPLGDVGVPQTIGLLGHLRGVHVAAFSLFRPGAYLPVHVHPELEEAGLYTYHLGLEAPPDYAYLFTQGTFVREETGRGFVFDGSKPHFAFNFSDRDRLILYLEFYKDRLRWVD
jgi:aspartyl/asparaginyl beta-hydroxylase (cupin superfamily)